MKKILMALVLAGCSEERSAWIYADTSSNVEGTITATLDSDADVEEVASGNCQDGLEVEVFEPGFYFVSVACGDDTTIVPVTVTPANLNDGDTIQVGCNTGDCE